MNNEFLALFLTSLLLIPAAFSYPQADAGGVQGQ
ncbi:hypothetical protein BN439_1395 [Erwinia amylovora Ea644]|nr:hypothetical protein BN439_1395 [Erwinia amylovora Ea644]CCP06481.1 hypothetical protein BN440_1439 [Erwinia amylovora MR1]